MILPKNNQKSYGVLHTENYFSFIGFCKKVNSDEIQSVDIYLDDELIDTLLADKKLKKIEDIYDIEGFGFTYNLPEEYISKKKFISFKNHETEENLQNSPYVLIDKTNKKFNEASFLYSLTLPIDKEKIKNMYCPNSIGFLATEENLEDEDFVKYIKELYVRFPQVTFKTFYFSDNVKTIVQKLFTSISVESVKLSNIYDLFRNIEVYISNNDRNILDTKILIKLREYSSDLFCIGAGLNHSNITIQQHEVNNQDYFGKFFDNLELLGFSSDDIIKYGNSYYEIYFKKASEKYGVDINFDLDEKLSIAHVYWNLKLGLHNHEFFKYSLDFAKKFAVIQKNE